MAVNILMVLSIIILCIACYKIGYGQCTLDRLKSDIEVVKALKEALEEMDNDT